MDRCWLHGAAGDALHALSCAAGYNIRWQLRAITRLGPMGLFCALPAVTGYAVALPQVKSTASNGLRTAVKPRRSTLYWFKPTMLAAVI